MMGLMVLVLMLMAMAMVVMISVVLASTDGVDSGVFANGGLNVVVVVVVAVAVVVVVVVVAAFYCLFNLPITILFIYLFPSNYLNITIITIPVT